MVHLSPAFNPPTLKGLKVYTDNPFKFDFILDQGDDRVIASEAPRVIASERSERSNLSNTKKIASSPRPSVGTPRNDTIASSEAQGVIASEAKQSLTDGQNDELKSEAQRLIKYFLAAITVPDNDLWVNLSPYEKDRIIPQAFGQTEMGRDLLAQDYLLKQVTASLIYPEEQTGREFWQRVYAQAQAKFGTTNIPVNTFNKVWIVPEKAVVYENAKAGTAYVVESKLKVMLEEDYLALSHSVIASEAPRVIASERSERSNLSKPKKIASSPRPSVGTPRNDMSALASQIVRDIVLPQLQQEINEGANFAPLRQVYNSLILAAWYKKKIKDSILAKVYTDKNKVAGIGYDNSVIASEAPRVIASERSERSNLSNTKKIASSPRPSVGTPRNDTEIIYNQYLQAFKKGVFNYIKEDHSPTVSLRGIAEGDDEALPAGRQESLTIPRKYFSGGVSLGLTSLDASSAMVVRQLMPKGWFSKVKVGALAIVTAGMMFGDAKLWAQDLPVRDVKPASATNEVASVNRPFEILDKQTGDTVVVMGNEHVDPDEYAKVSDQFKRMFELSEQGKMTDGDRSAFKESFDAFMSRHKEVLKGLRMDERALSRRLGLSNGLKKFLLIEAVEGTFAAFSKFYPKEEGFQNGGERTRLLNMLKDVGYSHEQALKATTDFVDLTFGPAFDLFYLRTTEDVPFLPIDSKELLAEYHQHYDAFRKLEASLLNDMSAPQITAYQKAVRQINRHELVDERDFSRAFFVFRQKKELEEMIGEFTKAIEARDTKRNEFMIARIKELIDAYKGKGIEVVVYLGQYHADAVEVFLKKRNAQAGSLKSKGNEAMTSLTWNRAENGGGIVGDADLTQSAGTGGSKEAGESMGKSLLQKFAQRIVDRDLKFTDLRNAFYLLDSRLRAGVITVRGFLYILDALRVFIDDPQQLFSKDPTRFSDQAADEVNHLLAMSDDLMRFAAAREILRAGDDEWPAVSQYLDLLKDRFDNVELRQQAGGILRDLGRTFGWRLEDMENILSNTIFIKTETGFPSREIIKDRQRVFRWVIPQTGENGSWEEDLVTAAVSPMDDFVESQAIKNWAKNERERLVDFDEVIKIAEHKVFGYLRTQAGTHAPGKGVSVIMVNSKNVQQDEFPIVLTAELAHAAHLYMFDKYNRDAYFDHDRKIDPVVAEVFDALARRIAFGEDTFSVNNPKVGQALTHWAKRINVERFPGRKLLRMGILPGDLKNLSFTEVVSRDSFAVYRLAYAVVGNEKKAKDLAGDQLAFAHQVSAYLVEKMISQAGSPQRAAIALGLMFERRLKYWNTDYREFIDEFQMTLDQRGQEIDERMGRQYGLVKRTADGEPGAAVHREKDLGGIDLTAKKMDLQVQGSGSQDQGLTFDPKQFENLNIDGLSPVIINIQPLTDLQGFLGIQ